MEDDLGKETQEVTGSRHPPTSELRNKKQHTHTSTYIRMCVYENSMHIVLNISRQKTMLAFPMYGFINEGI